MVVTLQSFDKGGKPEGPAMTLFDGPVPDHWKNATIQREANGSVTIGINNEDEFGNEIRIWINIGEEDLKAIQSV